MRDELRQARYLQALSRIHSSQAHDLRTRLGVVTLQLGLLDEWIQRLDTAAAEARPQLATHVHKAQTGLRDFHAVLEKTLEQMRPAGEAIAPFDVRPLLADLETRLAPFRRERALEWSLALPAQAVMIAGERGIVFQDLLATLVERMSAAPSGGRFALRLEAAQGSARLIIDEDLAAPAWTHALAAEAT